MECIEENIKNIFLEMKSEGWGIQKPLIWGFFFISKEKKLLKSLFLELSDYNYTLKYIHKSENNEWVMHVSKTEVLVPDKLHRRNVSFNELAEGYGSEYDGWDVGKNV